MLGEIMASAMRLNQSGELIQRIWDELPNRYTNLDLDAFIFMPNHLLGIIVLTDNATVGAPLAAPFLGRASSAPTPHRATILADKKTGSSIVLAYTGQSSPGTTSRKPLSPSVGVYGAVTPLIQAFQAG